VHSYDPPPFINGRPVDGFTGAPRIPQGLLRGDHHEVKEKWFTQRLDHYDDSDGRTWLQRYYINTQYFDHKKGPVFLMIGGEGNLSSKWLNFGAMVEYAAQHNALLLGLEHRFYGKSHPLGDTSVESLKYLSSEQALGDLATFRLSMTDMFRLDEDANKWIVFGGSYPGALSAWFRYKYPHLVHGAVATSAPIQAQLNFPQYIEVATSSLGTSQCQQHVREAAKHVEILLQTQKGREFLSKKFRTCQVLGENRLDHMQFVSTIAGNFFGVIQYNRDNRAWEGALGTNITIETLCGVMGDDKLGDTLDRYAVVNDIILKVYSTKCIDVSYTNFVNFLRKTTWSSENAGGARQWIYQTCTEFGYFQTTDSTQQVFGTSIPLDFYLQQCVDVYGKRYNVTENERGIKWTNTNYGGYSMSRGASRIVFPNGSIDPWHALSFVESIGDVVAVFIKGTAHCANMYPSSERDTEELKKARKLIGDIVSKWLV